MTPAFVSYSKQILKNASALAQRLLDKGYTLVTKGTDNHLILWDLRPQRLTGSKFQKFCDACRYGGMVCMVVAVMVILFAFFLLFSSGSAWSARVFVSICLFLAKLSVTMWL